MQRVISLYLPTWPTDRWRRSLGRPRLGRDAPPAEEPVVMVETVGAKRVIAAVDRAAHVAGARIGMPAAQARAMIENVRMVRLDAAADAAELEALTQWALRRFSPIVATDSPDGLRLDATGVSHLFGGEAAMMKALVSRLRAAGIAAHAAIAGNYGAAHALARFGAPCTIAQDAKPILDLPVVALRLPKSTSDLLRTLGLETIGALIPLPRAPLTHRFGPELLRRLDQALGRYPEPCHLVLPPDAVYTEMIFAEPIGAPESLLQAMHAMTRNLAASLERRRIGARSIDLLFHRVDDETRALRVGLGKPSIDEKAISRLFAERLPTIDPGFGVEKMTMSATWTEPFEFTQYGASFGEKPRPDLSSLIDTLSNRLGANRVYRLAPAESDVPERSAVRVSPHAVAALPWPTKRQPCRLLRHPQPVETLALLPDHPPRRFTWAGRTYAVRHADGPERIFGEWWKRGAEIEAVRDYFEVEVEDGSRYWLYRSGDGADPATGSGKWFLHGFFQ